jgi:hypothetical protein
MFGATIEISNASDSLVVNETVDAKKILIDLFDRPAGVYVIKIQKGDWLQTFTYQVVDHASVIEAEK